MADVFQMSDVFQFILNSKESKKSAESLYTFFWREIEKWIIKQFEENKFEK